MLHKFVFFDYEDEDDDEDEHRDELIPNSTKSATLNLEP